MKTAATNYWQMTTRNILPCIFLLFLLTGCGRGGGTVRHGNLSYNATEVFGAGTSGLILAEAAGRGDVKTINRQIAAGVNVNTVGKYDITPLWWAAWADNYEGFSALLDKGANPNAQRSDRYPIMNLIASKEDSRFLAAALKHGGNPNLRDNKSGVPPLFPSVMRGYKKNIDLLLAAKADVNWQDSISGETLPIIAIQARGDYELVYKFLEIGADPTLKDRFGHTLADTIEIVSKNASNNDDPWRAKVLEVLRSKGMTVSKPASK